MQLSILLQVALPKVRPEQRHLVKHLQLPGFHHVVCRFGYTEEVSMEPDFLAELQQQIAESVRFHAMTAK